MGGLFRRRKPVALSEVDLMATLMDGTSRTPAEVDALLAEFLRQYRSPWEPRGVHRLLARWRQWRFERGIPAGRRLVDRQQRALLRERKGQERLKRRLGLRPEGGRFDRYYDPD